jgi:cbb3-type cytochrome c oxidase subunit III
MSIAKRKVAGLAVLVVVVLVAVCVLFIYSGVYSVAAAKQHPAIEGQVLHKIMVESVRHHARDIRLPPGVDLHDRVLAEKTFGYTKACRTCHGAPGVKPDVWMYLYPAAPDLTRSDVVDKWSDAELYWIIKNGIEHTGMTGLGPTHQDEEIWSVSAFVRQLPTMSSAEYQAVADRYAAMQKNGEQPD